MTNDEATEWHREVISDATEAVLRSLRDAKVLDRFYLAGGTGLALRFGHRLSRDLDFFAPNLFDESSLLPQVDRLSLAFHWLRRNRTHSTRSSKKRK